MSNFIDNKLQIIGTEEQVEEVRAFISSVDEKGVKRAIDFNRILPMPQELNIANSFRAALVHFLLFGGSNQHYLTVKKAQKTFIEWEEAVKREAIELAFRYQENLEKYGEATWYTWRNKNWGPDENAEDDPTRSNTTDTLHFLTSWNTPVPVIMALSKRFPLVTLQLVREEDEETGIFRLTTFHQGTIVSDEKQTAAIG